MKTHTHYTISTTTTPWVRSRTIVLAALLILAVATFALVYALRSFDTTAVIPAAHSRVSIPRVFQDEVLGAEQANLAWRAAPSAPVISATRQHVSVPRVFRDEMLGADQANLAWLTAPSVPVLPAARQPGTAPRVFRDEVLGADQANLGSIGLPGGAVRESQPGDLGTSGPR